MGQSRCRAPGAAAAAETAACTTATDGFAAGRPSQPSAIAHCGKEQIKWVDMQMDRDPH